MSLHADTIRDNITCTARYDAEKGWHVAPTNQEALAAVDAWEAETKDLLDRIANLNGDVVEHYVAKKDAEAEVQRLRDALEQIAYGVVVSGDSPDAANLLDSAGIARAALAEEADRG